MKKVIVTGGAGFIGSAVVPKLKEAGYDVYVVDNLSFGNRNFIDLEIDKFFEIDIRDKQSLQETFKKVSPEIVIHLAAIHFIPYCNQNPFESSDINIRGTINVLEASKNLPNLGKVFFASTAAVYPISEIGVDENHPLLPLDIYGLSKLTGEQLIEKFHLETGIDSIVCRFFNAFGPQETNPHLIPEIERQLRDGARKIELGNLTPKRDFIHTYDMANAVLKLIELEKSGFDVFNLGRGIEYSVTEIVESFERILGEKVEIVVAPDRVRKVERMHLLANVSKLKERTGWEPSWTIDQGISDLINNWKA
jgi:UDP-glucose 4-epimerase